MRSPFDVTLLDKDGNEIQPNGALNVCFFDANVEGEEVGVYRVSDDASQVETIGARQADPPSKASTWITLLFMWPREAIMPVQASSWILLQ